MKLKEVSTNPRFESEDPSEWNSMMARFDMVRVTAGREEPQDVLRWSRRVSTKMFTLQKVA